MIEENKINIPIKYHNEIVKPVVQLGDWIDLRIADNIDAKVGDFVQVSLGISMALPEGLEAHVLPRSSTFRKYGLLLGNSQGIIDNAYRGENDVWGADFYATRDIKVQAGTRLLQFRLVKTQAESLNAALNFDDKNPYPQAKDRGGFGSTGAK